MLGGNIGGLLIQLVTGAPIFLLAVILHEVAHGYVAYLRGDPTAKLAGRLTLDPWRHIDPLGVLVYVVTLVGSGGRFAFGWAKPVPVNPYNLRHGRQDFAYVALAGPAANVLQFFAWAAIFRLLVRFGPQGPVAGAVAGLVLFGVAINAVLLVFNLIPVPPLDGSRVLAWLLPERHARVLDMIEPVGMLVVFGLLFLGVFNFVFALIQPLIGWATGLG
jgi:Zn-dependent protease